LVETDVELKSALPKAGGLSGFECPGMVAWGPGGLSLPPWKVSMAIDRFTGTSVGTLLRSDCDSAKLPSFATPCGFTLATSPSTSCPLGSDVRRQGTDKF
jgi:hypothetical protein